MGTVALQKPLASLTGDNDRSHNHKKTGATSPGFIIFTGVRASAPQGPRQRDQASCLMSCRADTSTSTEGPMVEVM